MANKRKIRAEIEAKIQAKKVMIFSKTTCGFSKMAKAVFAKYLDRDLGRDEYEAWDIENERDCATIQRVLQEMTGEGTVPRVFINGECIGGGTETQALERRGKILEKIRGDTGPAGMTQQAQNQRMAGYGAQVQQRQNYNNWYN